MLARAGAHHVCPGGASAASAVPATGSKRTRSKPTPGQGSLLAGTRHDAATGQQQQQRLQPHDPVGIVPRSALGALAGPTAKSRLGDSLDQELHRHVVSAQGGGELPTLPSRGAYHDPRGASQNVGNHIGTRSSVRQSKLFRMYESGNATKALLGQQSLQWDVERKEGAYKGRVFDAFVGEHYTGAGDCGREVSRSRSMAATVVSPGAVAGQRRSRSNGGNTANNWSTSSGSYGAHSSQQGQSRPSPVKAASLALLGHGVHSVPNRFGGVS